MCVADYPAAVRGFLGVRVLVIRLLGVNGVAI